MKKRTPHIDPKAAKTLAVALGLLIFSGALVLRAINAPLSAVLPSVVALLTNQARREAHLGDLTLDPVLSQAAQMKADDMAAKGYFAHVSPDGTQPWYWIDKAGYKYVYAGENLAVNYGESEELVTAWLNSPKHRANILGAHYTDLGIGMATGTYRGVEAHFVVQFFASPAK